MDAFANYLNNYWEVIAGFLALLIFFSFFKMLWIIINGLLEWIKREHW